jgi:hypothetical protein
VDPVTPGEAYRVAQHVHREALARASLEVLLSSPSYFGLTSATPLQRAICQVADAGRVLTPTDEILHAFGGALPAARPRELTMLSGTRTGKSLLIAALAVRATQACDLSGLARGEVPRYPIISLRKDLADVVFEHVRGTILAQEALRTLLLEEPTADTVVLRHPSGRPVEIKVVAGARAGVTLVARWLVGVAFDEFPRMVGDTDGVVNYDDMRSAVLSRLLPGAQVSNIGSPWAPFGPAYDQVQSGFGRPSADRVVVWAQADLMNPVWWTPERAADLLRQDPDAYRTDYQAQFLEPEELFFPASLIESSTRRAPEILTREPGYVYAAAMDPATRSNAWTLVVGTRRDSRRIVCRAHQWVPQGRPLDPVAVFAEMRTICESYGCNVVRTDQWSVDALRSLADRVGLILVQQDFTASDQYEAYKQSQTWLTLGQLELPPVAALLDDLKRVRRRVTQAGLSIVLPKTGDGRHCDFAPALVRLLSALHDDYEQPNPPRGTVARAELEARRMEEAEEAAFAGHTRQRNRNWFTMEAK